MTRRGGDIGKGLLTVFSIWISPNFNAQSLEKINPPSNQDLPHRMSFPNAFLGTITPNSAETFCIFRNSPISTPGLRDVSICHQATRWRLNYENTGSNEWGSQLLLIQHRLGISKNQQIVVGMGVIQSSGDFAQKNRGGILNFQYHFTSHRAGTFAANYTTAVNKDVFSGGGLPSAFWSIPMASTLSSWQYQHQRAQFIWMGRNKPMAEKTQNRGMPFFQAMVSPQQTYLEAGLAKWLSAQHSGVIAFNSTEQPLRGAIYYHKKAWSGGLEAKWQRPLGVAFGWQLRYHWQ